MGLDKHCFRTRMGRGFADSLPLRIEMKNRHNATASTFRRYFASQRSCIVDDDESLIACRPEDGPMAKGSQRARPCLAKMLNTCFHLGYRPELRIAKVTDIPRKRRYLNSKYYRLPYYLPDSEYSISCSATDLKIYASGVKVWVLLARARG